LHSYENCAEIDTVARVEVRVNALVAGSGGDVSNGSSETAEAARPVPGPAGPSGPGEPAEKAAAENFPVALRGLPRRYRRHLMAVYRFARLVDDVGDEGTGSADERMRLLDALDEDVMSLPDAAGSAHPVIRDLAPTVRDCEIPLQPFRDLIQANRQDQTVSRYRTFAELLGYCELSANPVGRIVLHVFSAATPERLSRSDQVCTALQLAEHWQDVAEDFGRGRVYLPADDLARFGCAEDDLGSPSAAPRLRELMAFETARAARMLDDGAVLVGTLRGYARLAVAGYVAGGRAALAAIGAAGHDVLSGTPRPRKSRVAAGLARAYLTGR
jgi:squalene synthase HpnC